MNMQTRLSDSFKTRWSKYKAELKNCRGEFSEEAVHDFRVATRRLLSFLDLLRIIMKEPGIKKIRRALKDQLDNLDELRDVQVQLADISEMIHETPMLQPFQEYLKHREKKLLRAARKEIKSLKIADLSRRILKLYKKVEAIKQTDLELDIFSSVDEAFALVNQRYTQIDPGQPATIHRVRIAFKKFRYMIEVVFPILENFPSDRLKKMHDYQTAMGDIQDMEVALLHLADFENLAPASYNPEPVRLFYKERHTLAISRYIEDKGEVFTFWRSTPDPTYPQEK